ncbi:hypothetical protein FEM08_21800 [Flavobacterium gilvum]|nr:hypothetical protein FEM08_21800 [Flavobacterium gilvum]
MIVDFNSQKKITENASHEILTPLGVIEIKQSVNFPLPS